MEQSLSEAESLPAISVTSPKPSEPSSSPATVEGLDDSRLTPTPTLPKTSPDQRQTFSITATPQPVTSPVSDHSFPSYNIQFKNFGQGTKVLDTQSNAPRCTVQHAACHVHTRNTQGEKDNTKNSNAEAEDFGIRSRKHKDAMPSFSSPWAPSSCSPKKVIWKEVEDYNRQRKRVRFVGWAGVENPWEMEGSSTACSEEGDCSDEYAAPGLMKRHGNSSENQLTRNEEVTGDDVGKGELGGRDGIKVVITTSKDGMTTTVLEAGPNAKLGDGVEIVTKTVVRGEEVTTVTTTMLIPLSDVNLRTERRD